LVSFNLTLQLLIIFFQLHMLTLNNPLLIFNLPICIIHHVFSILKLPLTLIQILFLLLNEHPSPFHPIPFQKRGFLHIHRLTSLSLFNRLANNLILGTDNFLVILQNLFQILNIFDLVNITLPFKLINLANRQPCTNGINPIH
jgi:hypothetical protein